MTPSRTILTGAKRVVIKVGTRVLVQRNGRPNDARLVELVREIAEVSRSGRQPVLVSSGAIGAGMEALKLRERPRTLPGLQMCAAVGQSRLMARYDQLFAAHGLTVGQVLLTHADLKDRTRHLNARTTMMHLLSEGIIPVVNENDTVSVDEIKFGDNDHLASLVTMLVDADVLILLTTVNGLRAPAKDGRTRRIAHLPRVDESTLSLIWDKESPLSSGGMKSKLEAAQRAADVGAKVVIADGRNPTVIGRVLAGADVGTLIGEEQQANAISSRKRWIAFFNRAQGTLTLDKGATAAVQQGGKSLLPIGVHTIDGQFPLGAIVNIHDHRGTLIGRGLVSYSSEDLQRIRGRRSDEVAEILGSRPYEEAIHRDNMLIFNVPAAKKATKT